MTIILDTPEQIDMYRWLMIRRGLKFEIETGIKMTRASLLAAAKREGYTDKNTKRAAFKQMNEMGAELGIEPIELKE